MVFRRRLVRGEPLDARLVVRRHVLQVVLQPVGSLDQSGLEQSGDEFVREQVADDQDEVENTANVAHVIQKRVVFPLEVLLLAVGTQKDFQVLPLSQRQRCREQA